MVELLMLKVILCGFGAALLVHVLAASYNYATITGYLKGVALALGMIIAGIIMPM